MKKLSQTKEAIRRRKQRATESPRTKRIRLLKRYIGLERWKLNYGGGGSTIKIKNWKQELRGLQQ